MSHNHRIVQCPECEIVLEQCRCIDQNKPTVYVLCEQCKASQPAPESLIAEFDGIFEWLDELREELEKYWNELKAKDE